MAHKTIITKHTGTGVVPGEWHGTGEGVTCVDIPGRSGDWWCLTPEERDLVSVVHQRVPTRHVPAWVEQHRVSVMIQSGGGLKVLHSAQGAQRTGKAGQRHGQSGCTAANKTQSARVEKHNCCIEQWHSAQHFVNHWLPGGQYIISCCLCLHKWMLYWSNIWVCCPWRQTVHVTLDSRSFVIVARPLLRGVTLSLWYVPYCTGNLLED